MPLLFFSTEETNFLFIILIIFAAIIILLFFLVLFLLFKKKRTKHFNNANNDNKMLLEKKIDKLEEISNLTREQTREIFLKKFEEELNMYILQKIEEANNKIDSNANAYAQEILMNSIQNISTSFISSMPSLVINVSPEEKAKIIGKRGINKKTIEQVAGVELPLLDENNKNKINISSLNPIRANLARNFIKHLITLNSIDPIIIEKTFIKEKEKFEKHLFDIGKKIIEGELKIFDLNHLVYPYVGRLQYRTYYGQSVLQHSLECAKICESIARDLNLDAELAKQVGFFHDIGKSVDFEFNHDHVFYGVKIANECELNKYVIDAIKTHHNETPSLYVYSSIVKVADSISAGRKGAREARSETIFKRASNIENICKEKFGLNEVYVMHAGRSVFIYLRNNLFINNDERNIKKLIYDIKNELNKNEDTKNYLINISVYKIDSISLKTK
ncbi:MAG: Rnase Y domain-containing protein [Mycoplasmataceae bacterium]|jgi:ribonuclease Y|nr:Rnase Y domain-containing protein [Mycoplasmataceae bacterium]